MIASILIVLAVASTLIAYYFGTSPSFSKDQLKTFIHDDGGPRPAQGSAWSADAIPQAGSSGVRSALQAADAAAVGRSVVTVTLDNTSSEAITIVGMDAVVHRRAAALTKALVVIEPGGGGPSEAPVNLGFDLDASDLTARSIENDRLTDAAYFDENGQTIEPGERLRLRLGGYSRSHLVAWSAVVRYVADGQEWATPIGSVNHSFHVSGANTSYSRVFVWAAGDRLRPISLTEACGGDCRHALDRERR